ncbi:MAG: SusC/RagA family TonB-linked outer membrane protein [Saprospiraceae bacterium]
MNVKITFKRSCSMLAMLFLLSNFAIAQRTVTGTVTDAKTGETLIGANILVVGTDEGTSTDMDGNYSLTVPAGATILEFTYTGYASSRQTLGASNVMNVTMSEGTLIDEVVVIGYGSAKRSDLTGAVASIEAKDFNKGIVVAADQLIQGRLAGVNVVNNSGQPGGEATIKIRGNNSIRAGANPLFVVDGVPLDGRSARAGSPQAPGDTGAIPNSNPLNFLNPNDIESITVLKDASSAAIYGSRGANGVVIVKTKKGRSQEPTVDFNVSLGTSNVLKKYDVLDGNEYRSALSDYGLTDGDGGSNVDAFDEILQTGITQRYGLSIGGGTKNGNYRVSLGLHDQEGIIKESGLKRYNAALSTNSEFLDNRVGMDVLIIASHAKEDVAPIGSNAGFRGNLVGQALQWNPTIPLMTDGDFTTGTNNNTNATVGATTVNPLHYLEAHKEVANTTTMLGSISPYFNITDKLQYRYRYGVNYGTGKAISEVSGDINLEGIENEGWAARAERTLTNQLHTHTLNYTDQLSSSLSLDVLVGYEYQKFDYTGSAMASRGFSIIDFTNSNALQNGANGNRVISSFADPVSELQSYFGRANLNVSDKYLLTATVRADGSTKFGENNKTGIFPSVAFRWNLHKEGFLDNGTFDNLALRVGWGQTGNQEFPSGASQELFDLLPNGGVQQLNVANPNLKWETATTFNVGLDFALFDYALTGTVEYFNRTTNDLLLDPFVSEPGPAVRAWQNISGEVYNSGVELELTGYVINRKDMQLSVGLNMAFLNNEFRGYEGAELLVGQLFGQGSSGATVQVMSNGLPLNTYQTRNFTGISESGTSEYENDGKLESTFGDPNADVIAGLSVNFSKGKFFAGLNFNGAYGHQLFNNTKMSVIPIGNLGNRNVDANLVGTSIQESKANPIAASSRYIEEGAFTKLANATVGYSFGDVGPLKGLGVTLTGQNLFIITDYTGFDPEVNTVNLVNGVPSSGIEYIPYPTARTFVLGLSASF